MAAAAPSARSQGWARSGRGPGTAVENWRPPGPSDQVQRSATSHPGAPHRPCQAPRSQEPEAPGPPRATSSLPTAVLPLGAPTARCAGSSPPPRLSPAQHPRQARALISATGPRKVAGAGGTGDADAGQQVARVARTAAQREVCACALLRRGVGGPDRGRGSASGSRPLGPPRVGVA